MPRGIPVLERRVAEEAVRRGLVAAVVMEAAAREWAAEENAEPFPEHLVRREILTADQRRELETTVAEEAVPSEDGGGEGGDGEAAPAAKPSHPSEVIKGFRILERLGRGGMGSVYRAEQQGMNRTVALKILRRPFGNEEQHVERLRREARLVGALDHPNIVRGLDIGQHGPYHYFAMEFVEGETLRDLLRRRGALPESEALRILEQVCLALDHGHSRAVVHRDVKPGNIILTPDGTPKLTDYGLAKGPADFSLTQSGVTMGTPQYISPEQARDPIHVDIQTDLYSLGATAYHLLTGIPPHTSETLAGLLTKVLYEKPRTARQANPRVSPGASFLVEKMMAKQKRHRYRTPKDVLRDLRALAAGRSIVPRDWAGDFEVHEVRRRYRVLAVAAVCVTLLGLGSTVFLQYRVREQERQKRVADAKLALDMILPEGALRDRLYWERRRDDFEEFLRGAWAGTPSSEVAASERERAQTFIDAWDAALGVLGEAQRYGQEQRNWRAAARHVETRLEEFKMKGAVFREPVRELQKQVGFFWDQGEGEAARLVKERLATVENLPVDRDGAAVVERTLGEVREQILDRCVRSEDQAPVVALDRVLNSLSQARATIEDSHFGAALREDVARKVSEGEFLQADELLASAQERIETDGFLLALLHDVPRPAARDLLARVPRERERVRRGNEEWLLMERARAQEEESRGRIAEALVLLKEAADRSLPDLRPPVEALRVAVEKRRVESDAAVKAAVEGLYIGILQEMSRRDYRSAARRLAEDIPGTKSVGGDPRVAEAILAAHRLLAMVEALAFGPALRERLSAGELPLGLKFEEGTKQLHLSVSGVRLKETPTGTVVIFDAPNQPGLQGTLHRLSLPLIFTYAGFPASGLSHEQAFVRGALVVLEGEGSSMRDLEAAVALLRDAAPGLPELEPATRALIERGEVAVSSRVRQQDDLERLAADTLKAAEQALQDRDPREALRLLDLLISRTLSTTRFAQERRPFLLDLRAQSETMLENAGLAAWFKGAQVSLGEPGPSRDSITRIRWPFDEESELKGFVPPEDGGPPLYRVFPDDPDPAGAPRGGRLVFLSPEPGPAEGGTRRMLQDSPLVLESPFKPGRYVALSFKLLSGAPLYIQVSVMGNHVGVLTDNGRREGGRGVYAWQSGDWRNPDQDFPPEYRHDYVASLPDPSRVADERGQRYFQFEPGITYAVKVEWNQGHLRLFVDNREIWDAPLRERNFRDDPQRFRIVTYTPCWIDDLVIEGVVDRNYWEKLRRTR